MTFRTFAYKVKELFPGPFGPESREIRFVG